MLLSDPDVVKDADKMMQLNFRNSPNVAKVYGSSLLDDWRKAYLRGDDKQAELLLKTIVNKTQGESSYYPLLMKISQHNAFDESPQYKPDRLEPTRFYTDMRNSVRKLAGGDSLFLADVDDHIRSNVLPASDTRQILEVCGEELAIRKKHLNSNKDGLWDVYKVLAGTQAKSGHAQDAIRTYAEARQTLKQFGLTGSEDDDKCKVRMERLRKQHPR